MHKTITAIILLVTGGLILYLYPTYAGLALAFPLIAISYIIMVIPFIREA
jgi:hypothetical protein